MAQEQLFASFLLDRNEGLEIALAAESVLEVAPVSGKIMVLPGGVDFLAGIMHLRDEPIPVINLKKRFGLSSVDYPADAKVAVVRLAGQPFALLVDDILDLFKADTTAIKPLCPAMLSGDGLVASLIHLEYGEHGGRTAQLLDLTKLFSEKLEEPNPAGPAKTMAATETHQPGSSRFVVFSCCGREYGVPIHYARELTLPIDIDRMFTSDMLAGALNLRNRIVPVMHAEYLLTPNRREEPEMKETTRVLVLASDECSFGLIVEEVKEILTIAESDILAMPAGQGNSLIGIYARRDGRNVLLLDMPNLVCHQIDELKSMSRIGNGRAAEPERLKETSTSAHHLITENCYLVFFIGKNFAIEIKDVVEIIENDGLLSVPGLQGYRRGVINLRGRVVPVVNLREFYGFTENQATDTRNRLIICRGHDHLVALEVDQLVTIYKQETYHTTPSLTPRLAAKRDTIDRLIEFSGHEGITEHVLVVNPASLVDNHLQLTGNKETTAADQQQV